MRITRLRESVRSRDSPRLSTLLLVPRAPICRLRPVRGSQPARTDSAHPRPGRPDRGGRAADRGHDEAVTRGMPSPAAQQLRDHAPRLRRRPRRRPRRRHLALLLDGFRAVAARPFPEPPLAEPPLPGAAPRGRTSAPGRQCAGMRAGSSVTPGGCATYRPSGAAEGVRSWSPGARRVLSPRVLTGRDDLRAAVRMAGQQCRDCGNGRYQDVRQDSSCPEGGVR